MSAVKSLIGHPEFERLAGRYLEAAAAKVKPALSVASTSSDPEWFVAYTNVKCERKAVEGLERNGIAAFLPERIKLVPGKRTGKPGSKKVPLVERKVVLFPRYLFISFRQGPDWWSLRRVDGIEAVLGYGGVPRRIPATTIEDLMVAKDMGLFDETRDSAPIFKVGQHVKIIAGPFASFPAVVESTIDQMACVLVGIFGRSTPVHLSFDDLEALDAKRKARYVP